MQANGSSSFADLRKPYLERSKLQDICAQPSQHPYKLWQRWFDEGAAAIRETGSPNEPNQMVLATASSDGMPSVRYVLLKGHDAAGFYFYTNYNSRKGRELSENPRASLCMYWPELHRQVRIEGSVVRTSAQDSEAYFRTRPVPSQIGAAVSPQSEVIASREQLEARRAELEARALATGEPVLRPDSWGGYRVAPDLFEFWQGQRDRLHDRVRFRRLATPGADRESSGEDGWVCERLAP